MASSVTTGPASASHPLYPSDAVNAPSLSTRKRRTASKAGGPRHKSKEGRTVGNDKKKYMEDKKKSVKDVGELHVSIWIPEEGRKLFGSSSPKLKHLVRYLRKNPKHQVWTDQKKNEESCLINRITMWDLRNRRKVTGAAAPLEKNLTAYLKHNPHMVVYVGQEKNGDLDSSRSIWGLKLRTFL